MRDPYRIPDYSPKYVTEEQTGSDLEFNFKVFTQTATKAIHGRTMHGAGAYVLRIHRDRVAEAHVVRGAMLMDRDGSHLLAKKVTVSDCGAWLLVRCERVE